MTSITLAIIMGIINIKLLIAICWIAIRVRKEGK